MPTYEWVARNANYEGTIVDPYTEFLRLSRNLNPDGQAWQPQANGKHLCLRLRTFDEGPGNLPFSAKALKWDHGDRRYGVELVDYDADAADPDDLFDVAGGGGGNANEVAPAYAHLAPLLADALPMVPRPNNVANYDAPDGVDGSKAVIIAVIDDYANIAHERFRDAHGNPRVDFVWVQDGAAKQQGQSNVMFGKEIARQDIAAALAGGNEKEALRALGYGDFEKSPPVPLSKRFSHGTAVLDKIGGADPADADGVNRRLISVQLPQLTTVESSGAYYSLFAVAGLRYIFDRATAMAKELRTAPGEKIPLIINFSYGIAGGPHNGQHLIERMIDQIVAAGDLATADVGPVLVPIPAGNRFLLDGHAHAVSDGTGPTELSLNWVAQPQDESPNYLEFWVPKTAAAAGFDLRVTSPDATAVSEIHQVLALDEQVDDLDYTSVAFVLRAAGGGASDITGRISVDRINTHTLDPSTATGSGDKIRILVALGPSYPAKSQGARLPSGIWKVEAKIALAEGEAIEAWVQRDDRPPGYIRQGRQSYLERRDEPDVRDRGDLAEHIGRMPEGAGLNRYGTVSGMATGNAVIRVGASRYTEDHLPTKDYHMPSLYSGAGSGTTVDVDLVAPGDRSRVFGGLMCATSLSGAGMAINGTSVAAPIVGRMLADYLQAAGRGASAAQVRSDFLASRTIQGVNLPDTPAGRALHDPDLRNYRGRLRVPDAAYLKLRYDLRR
ncbi:MAG: S8 family serine peptidase [Boseongicola sp.]|nr:MAG: S8 family serine peptidase [Boseongicola sp.]